MPLLCCAVLRILQYVIFLVHQSEMQRRNIVKTLVILFGYADLLSYVKKLTKLEDID
jgi:hypothetical protein